MGWGEARWVSAQDQPQPGGPPLPGAIGVLTVISKGCSSHCKEDSQNYYVSRKNVTCCSTDLCNANGAHAPRPAVITLGLLTTVLSLLLWGPSQL